MIEAAFPITWPCGLAECSAPRLAETAGGFRCRIKVGKDGLEVNGKSLLSLFLLAADTGSTIFVFADGPDEREAMAAIAKLFAEKFYAAWWSC
jgi:phosphocarrier protein